MQDHLQCFCLVIKALENPPPSSLSHLILSPQAQEPHLSVPCLQVQEPETRDPLITLPSWARILSHTTRGCPWSILTSPPAPSSHHQQSASLPPWELGEYVGAFLPTAESPRAWHSHIPFTECLLYHRHCSRAPLSDGNRMRAGCTFRFSSSCVKKLKETGEINFNNELYLTKLDIISLYNQH